MVRLTEEEKRRIGERLKRQVLRHLVSSTDVLAEVILKAGKCVYETLEADGFEGRQLACQCKLLLDAIDWILPAYDRYLAKAAEAGRTPEAAGLPDLEAKLPALREGRPKLAEILDLATRPPRPVDQAMLNESKASFERGEFVTRADCIADDSAAAYGLLDLVDLDCQVGT